MESIPRLNLLRCKTGDTGTFGVLKYGDKNWFTGECPERDNKPGLSCVPVGLYRCDWLWSPSHERNVYHLLEVPNRVDVEIHAGNWAGDVTKGFKSDVKGCILLGTGQAERDGQWAIVNSRKAIADFEQSLGGQSFMLNISSAYMDHPA